MNCPKGNEAGPIYRGLENQNDGYKMATLYLSTTLFHSKGQERRKIFLETSQTRVFDRPGNS